jgi:transposase-like protein
MTKPKVWRERRKRGRPTKYDPAFCAQIVAHAKTGGDFRDFARSIGVSRSNLNAWADAHGRFLIAMAEAKRIRAAWLREQLAANPAPLRRRNLHMALRNALMDSWPLRKAVSTAQGAERTR